MHFKMVAGYCILVYRRPNVRIRVEMYVGRESWHFRVYLVCTYVRMDVWHYNRDLLASAKYIYVLGLASG